MAESATERQSGTRTEANAQPGGREAGHQPVSVTHLLRQLVDDAATLIRKELALATSEISQSIHETRTGATSLATGGAVLYAGLLFLLAAATLGLAEVMAGWLAALIVGGVVTIIGLIMLQAGRSRLSSGNFVPTRTAASIRRDREIFEREHHEPHQ